MDRNPCCFGLLLDYMREGRRDGNLGSGAKCLSEAEITQLKRDIEFYQIHSLKVLTNNLHAGDLVWE